MYFAQVDWDETKNRWLGLNGRLTFDEVLAAINEGARTRAHDHPTRPGQKIMVVWVRGYPHAVPFEQRGDVTWLITVYPARKYKNEKEQV